MRLTYPEFGKKEPAEMGYFVFWFIETTYHTILPILLVLLGIFYNPLFFLALACPIFLRLRE